MKRSGWIIITPAAFFFILNFAVSPVKVLFFSRFIYFLFLVSLFYFLRGFDLKRILKGVVGGISFIIFAYGLVQKFFLFPYYLKTLSPQDNFYSQAVLTRIKSGRIFSIFALPTLYAIVCAVLILFIFHYLLKSRSVLIKISWAGLLLLGLANLLLTQSFGGIACLSGGILLYLLLSGILKLKYLSPVFMVLAFFFFLTTGLRFSEAKELEPVKLRFSNWQQAVRMIEQNVFLGQGLGNYESQVSYYVYPGEARSIYAHNFFLQFAAEVGVVFPLFILLLLFFSRRKLKPAGYKNEEQVLYISALFILLVYNLVDIGFFFFTAGLAGVVCLSQVYPRKSDKFKLNCALLVLLAALLLVESISDSYQKRGEFWLNQRDQKAAETNYKRSLQVNPYNLRALVGCARIYYDRKDEARAEYYLDRLLELYPDSSFANDLKSKIEYKKKRYFNTLYYSKAATDKDRLSSIRKRQYENIKNSLQAEFAKPGN